MPNKHLAILITFIFLTFICSKDVFADTISAPVVSTPSILNTTQIEEGNKIQLKIDGLVQTNNEVLIYINGSFVGMANISQGNNKFSHFSYTSSILSSVSDNTVTAIARNNQSLLMSAPVTGKVSSIIYKSTLKTTSITPEVIVESPTFLPLTNINCVEKIIISGKAPSNSIVDIYIDGKKYSSLSIAKSDLKLSSFNFSSNNDLDRGQHTIYLIGKNTNGKSSAPSKTSSFCISTPQVTASSTVYENTYSTSSNNTINIPSSSQPLVFQKTSTTPLQSNKGIINIIIFSLFVAGILLWVILVNKDLSKQDIETEILNKPIIK